MATARKVRVKKAPGGRSNTERSLAYWRAMGYVCEVVEHYQAGHKHDLFGLFDILGIHAISGDIILVQTTSDGNVRARMRKILEKRNLLHIFERNGKVFVIVQGWTGDGTQQHYRIDGNRDIEMNLDRRSV